MSPKEKWTSERVRALRGTTSREAFAERLGVTPLTVYRWELPDGAAQARRPRGSVARRLEALTPPTRPREASSPTRAEEPATEALSELLPILTRLEQGELPRVESELALLLASGRLRTPATRALATQALVRCQLWLRGEVLPALATLSPVLLLADEGALPPSVELEVHVTAALLFSSFDGRVFDLGRTNAHIARAERLLDPSAQTARFLLWWSQLLAAFMLNEPVLIERALARKSEINRELPSPMLRCFAVEARLVEHYFSRQPASAARDFEELLELSAPFPMLHVRALAQAARNAIDEGHEPKQVLALCERARHLTHEARLAPGLPALYTAYAEGEALFRTGQMEAAERVWHEGLRVAQELRWPTGTLTFFLVRTRLLGGRSAEVRALAEAMPESVVEAYAAVHRGLRRAMFALADIAEERSKEPAVDTLDAAVRELDRHNVWSFLRRSMVLVNAIGAITAGSVAQAERALRHAERVLDSVSSAYGQVVIRWLRGLFHLRCGEPEIARPILEASRPAFEMAGDRIMGSITSHLLAVLEADAGDERSKERLQAASDALRTVGVLSLEALERREPRAPRSKEVSNRRSSSVELNALVRGFQRLSTRGSSADGIQRALVSSVEELFPGAKVSLQELDAGGPLQAKLRSGAQDGSSAEWIEFGDGAGRRYRLELSGVSSSEETRELLELLVGVASLALEIAALRGLSVAPEATAPAATDDVDMPGFIAASAAMRRIRQDLGRLARSRATIIITGESGVGKEVVARAIHDLSVRANRAYVAFNCAAVPRELFEGQLFGHRKGAFTGAATDHPGVIRAAQGGTLFLDEIGELPLEVQPKLLRFLENGEVFPLGSDKPVQVDVRVVAATFRDLEQLVREGRFREDLYYRLQVVPLVVPPLRERPEDVLALARFFIQKLTREGAEPPVLAPAAAARLAAHRWPGNVRELRNVIERSLAFEPWPKVLAPEHLRLA